MPKSRDNSPKRSTNQAPAFWILRQKISQWLGPQFENLSFWANVEHDSVYDLASEFEITKIDWDRVWEEVIRYRAQRGESAYGERTYFGFLVYLASRYMKESYGPEILAVLLERVCNPGYVYSLKMEKFYTAMKRLNLDNHPFLQHLSFAIAKKISFITMLPYEPGVFIYRVGYFTHDPFSFHKHPYSSSFPLAQVTPSVPLALQSLSQTALDMAPKPSLTLVEHFTQQVFLDGLPLIKHFQFPVLNGESKLFDKLRAELDCEPFHWDAKNKSVLILQRPAWIAMYFALAFDCDMPILESLNAVVNPRPVHVEKPNDYPHDPELYEPASRADYPNFSPTSPSYCPVSPENPDYDWML